MSSNCARSSWWLAEAAAGANQFAGDPLGIVRSEERGDTGDIIHLTDAAKRGLRDGAFLEVGADEARGVYAFGLNHAGVDGVDADLFRAQLFREDAGDRVHRALGRRCRPRCSAASGC